MITRIEVNLLPAEYRVHTMHFYLRREVIYPLIAAFVVAVSLAGYSIFLNTQERIYNHMIADTQRLIDQNKGILEEIKTLKSQRIKIQEKIRALERINVNREMWLRLQEVFCRKLPESTWLERIEEKGDSSMVVEIEGKTLSFGEVAQYMGRLKESDYVRDLTLIRIEQTSIQEKVFKFLLQCIINRDAGLKKAEEI